jgi:hypothetical protein
MIQVDGTIATVIPEPASWLLGTIGLSTMFLASRRSMTRR